MSHGASTNSTMTALTLDHDVSHSSAGERWATIQASPSTPRIEAHTRPTNGGNSHEAMARVASVMNSSATSAIGTPTSPVRNSSSSSGRGSMERHHITAKHSAHHSTSAPSSRSRDQRHIRPSTGMTGQARTMMSQQPGNDQDEGELATRVVHGVRRRACAASHRRAGGSSAWLRMPRGDTRRVWGLPRKATPYAKFAP